MKRLSVFWSFLLLSLTVLLCSMPVLAAEADNSYVRYTNEETGYQLYYQDAASLLGASEEEQVLEVMKELTKYSNIAFVSYGDAGYRSTGDIARSFLEDNYYHESASVFVIDMDNRQLWIQSQGKAFHEITVKNANAITDNVYRFARSGNYGAAAQGAYREMLRIHQGLWIARPLQWISNAILAVILSFLVLYVFLLLSRFPGKKAEAEILGAAAASFALVNLRKDLIRQNVIRQQSSSGGSSSHGGGFSGGGGFSSGGGGHRF